MPILAAVAFCLLMLTFCQPADAQEHQFKSPENGSYALYNGSNRICSGFFFRSDDTHDFFLTAAHCLRGSGKLSVRKQVLNDQFEVVAEHIIYLEPRRVLKSLDIAVLETRAPAEMNFEVVELATELEAKRLVFGDSVIAVGFPKGLERTITSGLYTGPVRAVMPGLKQQFFRATVPITGGSSGGGIYMRVGNTWKLFGTASYRRTDSEFLNVFANTKSVRTAVKGLMDEKT